MIWARRILTIPLGLLLLVLILVTLVVLQISGSFLDHDYYSAELRKADVYEFALVDVLTLALDEARQLEGEDLPDEFEDNPLVTSGLSTEEIVASVNAAIPPDWVQSIVEQVFEELGRYLTGQRDEFEVTVRAGERVGPIVAEVKDLLRKADAYNLLFEELVTPNATDLVVDKLPLGLTLDGEDVVSSVRRVVDPNWVQLQVEAALDELTPYVDGSRDSFEIEVQLSDRVEIALAEVKSLLRKADAYDLLYDEVVEPRFTAQFAQFDGAIDLAGLIGVAGVELPVDVTVSDEEILSVLREAADPDWVQEQSEIAIDNAGRYLTGRANTFSINISLVDNKADASDAIARLVRGKVQEVADGLPVCDAAVLTDIVLSQGAAALGCIPAQFSVTELLEQASEEVSKAVAEALNAIPDNIVFADTDLRKALSDAGAGENLDLVDDVRRIIDEGWSYTDAELREDLRREVDEEAVERLDDVRAFLADGWTYTEVDFREDIDSVGDADALDNLDLVRRNLDRARTLRLLIVLPALLLLVAIGFLGGRGWRGRVAWSAAFLVAISAITFLAFGPVYSVFGETQLDDAREEALEEIDIDGDFQGTERLVADRAFDIAESMVNGIASGIALKSLLLLIVGGVALAASIFWDKILSLVRRSKPQPES